MTRRNPLLLPALLAALNCGPAAAQSIDYGALETLFGEPVTLSATGKPQRASDVPATMEIITAEQIRRSAATDVPGVLRRLAGVDVYRSSMNGADVSIRGYTMPMNSRILVLVDGRQIYNDSFGFISWDLLPVEMDEIRQIEVIKGPQSALYGFNAAAGVINILTFNPLDAPVNSARARVGTQAHRELSGVTTVKAGDRAAVRVSAGGFDSRASGERPNAAALPYSPVNPARRSAHADGVADLGDYGRLGLSGGVVTGRERRLNWGYFITDMSQEADSIKADWSGETGIGLMSASAYHNRFDVKVKIPDLGDSPVRNSATVASLQDLFKIGADNSIRLSAEYRRNESSVYGNRPATLSYDVWSAGAMWDSALSETVSLVNAVRFDDLRLGRTGPINPAEGLTNRDFDRSIEALSFNSGLVWRITDRDTGRLTAARGLNLPSLSNLGAFEVLSSTPILDYGNPTLKPAEVWNYELSWDHALPALNAGTRASLFYQENDGLIDYGQAPFFRPGYRVPQLTTVNYGDSRTVGVELGVTGKVDTSWTWGFNYTVQWIRDQMPERSPLIFPEIGFARRTPQHKVNARFGWSGDPWEIDLDLHYLSGYGLPDAGPEPSDRRARAMLGDTVILEPRIGYHITPEVTAELTAQGLWRRQELPLGVIEPRVLFSVVGRW